jgi:hypothetical protein
MTSEAQASLAKPNLKPSRPWSSEIADCGLALSFSREALLLHSNSSRVGAVLERQELTLKPHSWHRVVFRAFSEARFHQKRCVFKAKDPALYFGRAAQGLLRSTDLKRIQIAGCALVYGFARMNLGGRFLAGASGRARSSGGRTG